MAWGGIELTDAMSTVKAKTVKRYSTKANNYAWAYIMILPTIVGVSILNIWPIIQTLIISLSKDLGFNNYQLQGFQNYQRFIADPIMWKSLGNSLLFTSFVAPVGVSLSLILAVLLNSSIRGRSFLRSLYFLPMVVAPAALAVVWTFIFNSDSGVLNAVLRTVGLQGTNWLTNPNTVLLAVAVVTIWNEIGYNAIIIMAGLQNISNSYYEAAKIDGASPLQCFFSITIPQISSVLFFVLTTRVIFSIKQFDFVFMMVSESSPVKDRAATIIYRFYEEAFKAFDKGYASSIAVVTLATILLITLLQFVVQKKWVNYD